MSPKTTNIPDSSGAITTDALAALVTKFKSYNQTVKLMSAELDGDKLLFRKEAGRRMATASPGTTRVEFTDGAGNCVMVSALDMAKKGSRKSIPHTTIQMAVEAGMDLEGKVETEKTMAVSGAKAKEILDSLANSEEALVLTGNLVEWFRGVFAAQGQQVPDSVVTFKASEDIEVSETHRLTAEAAAELQKRMNVIAATGEKLDGNLYDAMKALLEASIKSAPVNVR